mmetsp:Transcript_28947/g.43724  ORF Transcript_28947/g.43724 Transcript_28947/m.43724 type:complete len:430 (-) Transcript_28947:84-1373(-)|eukprot:CAMPEP_0178908058 /NCGR_PEP_ID=MMETSP0786-20121207/7711_1 /TAXON_ID=186022 /ORGANISM="Thalassionema frauenfeldii, Strain CCMP 1798" /LENGTH=429 /DNA_ID=CAMNT_0020579917 /DNA_START=20 /DNA_END=1309 /DNA_ORIENTATION=+
METTKASKLESIDFSSPSGWIRNVSEVSEDDEPIINETEKEQGQIHHEGIILATMWKGITRYAYINEKETKYRNLKPINRRNFDEISALSSTRIDVEEVVDENLQALKQRIISAQSTREDATTKLGQQDCSDDEIKDPLRALKARIAERKISSISDISFSSPRKRKENSELRQIMRNFEKSPTSVVISDFGEEKKEPDGSYSPYGDCTQQSMFQDPSSFRFLRKKKMENELSSIQRGSLFSRSESSITDHSWSSEKALNNENNSLQALKERIRRRSTRSQVCVASESDPSPADTNPTETRDKTAPSYLQRNEGKVSERDKVLALKERIRKKEEKRGSLGSAALLMDDKPKTVPREEEVGQSRGKESRNETTTETTEIETVAGQPEKEDAVPTTSLDESPIIGSNESLHVSEMANPISYYLANVWSLSAQ